MYQESGRKMMDCQRKTGHPLFKNLINILLENNVAIALNLLVLRFVRLGLYTKHLMVLLFMTKENASDAVIA